MVKKKAVQKKTEGNPLLEVLASYTADTAVLYIKTLNFHWNMVGSEFFMYHRLLEEQYKELAEGLDELAERIRMLKGKAPGSMKEFLALSDLSEAEGTYSQKEMILELVHSNQWMVEQGKEIIQLSDSLKDPATSDLVIDRIRAHDKNAWLLKSHL